MKSTQCWGSAFSFVLLSAIWPCAAMSQTVDWIRQLGTSSPDCSYSASADGLGTVYISGYTEGSLGGPHQGNSDASVARISEVPEPSALLLVLAMLACLPSLRRLSLE